MQNNRNGIKANNSSLIQRIKNLLFGQTGPREIHTHVYIKRSDLSPRAQQSMDALFNELFSQPFNQ
ncbi:hypothetical protein [Flavobacterium sp. UMI-01]|uniref:hypothetical protein n=1 Tax=Flavobacterium sp. UMI-01 TaxID=1441053 RepID=UPI001C7D5EC8|nr:hypothetical protein [Flavobacterium sp. UMI-01]GIZ08357.1 hypothetical protein FUMI01_10840 [Flavobacterium sp. UMI-01]